MHVCIVGECISMCVFMYVCMCMSEHIHSHIVLPVALSPQLHEPCC